ncbi:MAG TPA: hypothetical protein VFW64_12135 [Pseudonocardiaceae bacterium]|nr:hypothetical protein [Pseudonocardiaceae bacterium]
MSDLDAIRARFAYPRPDREWCQRDRDVDSLIAEVEHLRAVVAAVSAVLCTDEQAVVKVAAAQQVIIDGDLRETADD